MYGQKKLLIALILAICLVLTIGGNAFAASFSDVQNHWAQAQIEKWADQGLIGGYQDGTFKPNKQVSRAEFVAMTNRAFDIKGTGAEVGFADVKATDWFYAEVSKAYYMAGYQDNTFKPNQSISRQEAAAILSRLLGLETVSSDALGKFKDAAQIPQWSKGAVAAVVSNGLMGGYPDQTFKPTNPITRAEAVVTLDRAKGLVDVPVAEGTVFDAAGTYGPEEGMVTITGNVTIKAAGVKLQNTRITGQLLLGEGIGNGDVELNNVIVLGKTTIKGGGKDSIIIVDCTLRDVIVNKAGGNIRIVVLGSTTMGTLTLNSGAILEEGEGDGAGFRDIIIVAPAGATIILQGDFGNVTVDSPNVNILVQGGTIAKLTVTENASGATIDLDSDSTVTTLELNTATKVTGEGTIGTAKINADGCTIEQSPSKTEVKEGVTATVAGKTETGTKPIAGGGGGGGGDTTKPSVTNIVALNLNIEPDSGTEWSVSRKNGTAIGQVTITFSEPIKKASLNDINLRAYNAVGQQLVLIDETEVKNLLFSKFSGGNTSQLEGNIAASYDTLLIAMNLYVDESVPNPTGNIEKLKFDVFDLAGNKLTLELNIAYPV